jgi:homoserine dehydrogenase
LRDEIGLEIGMQAPGAGKYPTAAAILEDLICVAKGRKLLLPGCSENIDLRKIGDLESNYYLRFSVLDRAGVLARISGVLGDYDISIKSVLQKGEARNSTDSVPIIMLTHKAKEKSIQDALKRISDLSAVKEYPLLIRVEEGIF